MSGQPHQFGGFSNNPATAGMRNNFATGPMQGSMGNQLTGVMSPVGMSGMNTQMGQTPYAGTGMQGQMGNMPGMPSQSMAVVSSTPSPNQNMSGVSMGAAPNMPSSMPNTGLGMTGSTGNISNNPAIANTMNNAGQASTTQTNINQNTAGAVSQANQGANQPQQNKEFNTASLCRFGQETVQDIVSRTQEVFQTLKAIQPPNGTPSGLVSSNEKKAKIQEQLRTIRLLFKRLRLIYEKCNENCQVPGMEYTHIESLIPLKDEFEHNKTIDEKKTSEAYRLVCEENRELTEQVVLKNKHLKEVVTNLRTIIWQINVMLDMRKT